MIIDYDTIYAESPSALVDLVKKSMDDGWKPLGGMCVLPIEWAEIRFGNQRNTRWEYHQAVVKYA